MYNKYTCEVGFMDSKDIALNIKGLFNTDFTADFKMNDMWKGRIILKENSFEGIVKELEYDCYVTGFLNGNEIELFYIRPFIDCLPIIYRGNITSNGYFGRVYEIDEDFNELEAGSCYIKLSQGKIANKQENVELMQKRIGVWKELYLSGVNEYLYVEFMDKEPARTK